MGTPLYADLWQGKEDLMQTVALRCGEKSLTFDAFFQAILRAEAGLRVLGVGPGDLVTLITLNTPEAVIAFYAIDRIGAVANWLDTKLSPAEVEDDLTRANSKVVLVLELAFAKVFQNRGRAPAEHFVALPLACYLPSALGEKLHLNTWQDVAGPGCMAWDTFLQEPQVLPPEKDRWEEPVAITYTGGTTGPAKGVMLSRRAFRASLEQYTQAETEYGRGGENLDLLPLFSAFGLCQCVHVPLCLGMGVILHPLFRPDQLGQALRQYRPAQVSGTTSYWQLFLQDAWAAQADLSFLKVPRCGGDVLPVEMERRINALLAQRGCSATLVKEYGMSEVAGIVCVSYGYGKVGDAGRPLPGCQIVAVDPETGELCPPGIQGELIVHSATQMNGYYGMPEADAQVLKPGPDGKIWMWTKDLGHTTEDGRVIVTGRKKRMISRHGFKIFPSVIEDCLLSEPGVLACAVVGGITPKGEMLPVVHIVAASGQDTAALEAALRKLVKRELNLFLHPGAYYFHDSLPLTERGKLDYRTLEQETNL
jgi:long-chain acyl-CoA synthetase